MIGTFETPLKSETFSITKRGAPHNNIIYGLWAAPNLVYVGRTSSPVDRWRLHQRSLRANKHQSPKLQVSYNLRGEDAFTFTVLEFVPIHGFAVAYERDWLYNLQNGNTLLNTYLVGKPLGEWLSNHLKQTRAEPNQWPEIGGGQG